MRPAQVQAAAAKNSQSRVWLSGAKCSPLRLPMAIVFTVRNLRRMMTKDDSAILAIVLGSIAAVYASLVVLETAVGHDPSARHWTINLLINLIGYSAVGLPIALVINYVKRNNVFEQATKRLCLEPVLRLCIWGNEDTIDDSVAAADATAAQKDAKTEKAESKSQLQTFATLLFCFLGLQVSYLTWGVLQEKVMTTEYHDSAGNVGKFKDSQFLVFVNRILAFALALLYITLSREPRHRAPIYKYSFSSLSNILSSWCQYEALKFVSFPIQVMAKASKIIPVMVMGKVVSKRTYDSFEWIVAALISMGMAFFLWGSQEDRSGSTIITTASGIIILVGYMVCDSFTSNWQQELFDTYHMTSMQFMCGQNLFSCLFTSASLLQQGAFYTSLVFMSQFPKFTMDCVILSVCSAVGQLFVYFTISRFGAVTFTIIMTLRQLMAILLSCFIYNHTITAFGGIGVLIVFGATFLKMYYNKRRRDLKALNAKQGNGSTPVKS